MHRIYLLLLVVITCTMAQAQVSLDSSEFPVMGTNYLLNNVAYVDFPPSAVAGPNETYDFTGGFTYGGQLIEYFDATLGPFAAQYPSSSLSRYIPGNIPQGGIDQHFYYSTDVSGFWQNGTVWIGYIIDSTSIDTLFFYLNPPNEDTLLSNQYTYGYSDSTYSLTELTISLGPNLYKVDYHLTKQIDADGWGTMSTDLGSYDSVLRVHVTEYKYDSVFWNGNFNSATQSVSDYYLYYKEGIRYPLVKEFPVPFVDTVSGTSYYITEILNIPPPPPIILGCMDTAAINYNPIANTEDSSCVYCPIISYTITPDTYTCPGGSTTLSVTGGSSYLWSTGEMTATITVSPDSTTVYSVYVNASQFCWALATVVVSIYQDVNASFWTGTITNTDSTVFVNLSTEADAYYWDFGDSTTSTLKNPTHLYSSLGPRTVRLIASNLCSVDTFEIIIEVVISISESEKVELAFDIFPNPGDEGSTVLFELKVPSLVTIRVVDILGKARILENEREYGAGTHSIHPLNRDENLPVGIYFIEFCVNGNCTQKKWIKQ